MQHHSFDALSLVLGVLAISMAVAGLAGSITLDWIDLRTALSAAALVVVGLVAALGINLVVRRRTGLGEPR